MERFPWTLLLGPGPSLAECLPLLETLRMRAESSCPEGIEQLETWDALFCEFPEVGRILIDADSMELRNVGLIESFLAQHPGWELWLLGEDPSARASRELLQSCCATWIPAPLDVPSMHGALISPMMDFDDEGLLEAEDDSWSSELEEVDLAEGESLVEPLEEEPDPQVESEESEESDELVDGDLLSQVERILRGEVSALNEHVSISTPAHVTPEETRELEPAGASVSVSDDAPSMATAADDEDEPQAPARYFRHQVADLADIVQCIDLGIDRAAEEAAGSETTEATAVATHLDELRAETVRLRQYTRTLSYLVSPPMRGDGVFDLAPMLEEMLTMRRSEPDAPRYLLRTSGELPLRADKQLLSQALDALLFLAHKGAGEEGTVRVDARLEEGIEVEAEVQLSIRFPAGLFSDISPARLLEPYALRRLLPELGANALAAAAGILRGQGCSLGLSQESSGNLEWVVILPCAD